jgi:hypothetical protein
MEETHMNDTDEDTDFVLENTTPTIEPGSLEWFRAHAPLPLLLRAFFDVEKNRGTFDFGLDGESCVDNDPEFWDLIIAAERLVVRFEEDIFLDDPNAKEIAARLRRLTGCRGNLLPSE